MEVSRRTIDNTTLYKYKCTAREPKMRSWIIIFLYVKADALNDPKIPATNARYILSTDEYRTKPLFCEVL
jgi:hypothetical protein